MADIAPVSLLVNKRNDVVVYKWVTFTENDTAMPVSVNPHFSDVTVQVAGDFGSGAVGLEGSLDPTAGTDPSSADWFDLSEPIGDTIAITADGGKAVLENVLYARPKTPTGTSVDVDVYLLQS